MEEVVFELDLERWVSCQEEEIGMRDFQECGTVCVKNMEAGKQETCWDREQRK